MTIKIRPLKFEDIAFCERLVLDQWGRDAAARAVYQMGYSFHGPRPRPHFYIAYDPENEHGILGFAGFHESWEMRDFFNLIFIVVTEDAKSQGVGRALTEWRLAEIKRQGGTTVSLVTQKVAFFAKMGFKAIDELNDGWTRMTLSFGKVGM